jgi:AcrR family transcriptional regulator
MRELAAMRRHTIAKPRVSGREEPPGRPERRDRPEWQERATRKRRETDQAFREAARTVFARDGYLNAKISDIAAEAGKSVASFYNYYDTKADLLIALAEEFHAEATQMAVLPYRRGLTRQEALREAVAGFWRTYAKRRGELIGVFQAAMLDVEFLDRWLDIRAEAVARIARQIRQAQSEGFCPGVDPVLSASALSAMLEHFSYIWLGQAENEPPFSSTTSEPSTRWPQFGLTPSTGARSPGAGYDDDAQPVKRMASDRGVV